MPYQIAIIGAGAVGSSLGRALLAAGHRVFSVTSRSPASARRLAAEFHAAIVGEPRDLPGSARIILVCVPDREIESVAVQLAAGPDDGRWSDIFVLHTSGALDAGALKALSDRGAWAGSLHPVLSLVHEAAPSVFRGARVHLEGDEHAVAAGAALATSIGASPHVLSSTQKRAVHLAATIASNYLVTLTALSAEVLAAGGVAPEDTDAILRPLMRGTLNNLDFAAVEHSLTGPVARGDVGTLELHRETLSSLSPDLATAYWCLATETVRTAVRGGFLSQDQAESLQDFIVHAIAKVVEAGERT
jgi:predicted short-subunit dehydrogenase-like oxidoreductase (DUF2520 family)